MNSRMWLGFVRFLVRAPASRPFIAMAFVVLILYPPVLGSMQAGAGNLDPSFGDDGRVTTDFTTDFTFVSGDRLSSIAIQKDGRIVAAGTAGGRIALARYNVDGSLDLGFGLDGKEAMYLSTEIVSIAIQTNGMIIAAGYTSHRSHQACFCRW